VYGELHAVLSTWIDLRLAKPITKANLSFAE
jgi:hypothetical protein